MSDSYNNLSDTDKAAVDLIVMQRQIVASQSGEQTSNPAYRTREEKEAISVKNALVSGSQTTDDKTASEDVELIARSMRAVVPDNPELMALARKQYREFVESNPRINPAAIIFTVDKMIDLDGVQIAPTQLSRDPEAVKSYMGIK